MVKIKNVKKFKKYNMRVVGNSILLICKNKIERKTIITEYDIKELLKDVYNIGKNFNKLFNEYFKSTNEKISYDIIHFEKINLEARNQKIIDLFKENCSRDFVLENNKDVDFINLDKYNTFLNFYKNSYNLFKKEITDIGNLATPEEIHDLILEDKFGISNGYSNAFNNLELNYIALLRILNNNKKRFDYSSLINSVSYIPIKITQLFDGIVENNQNNEYSKKVFNIIETFCRKYGLPYWKEKIYDKQDVEIPINNFIFISLAIYIFMEIWDKIKKYDNYDEWEEFIYSFQVLNIHFSYYEEKEKIIEEVVKIIQYIDFYIMNNCNELLNHNINIERKKVFDKKTNTLRNETVYESTIIAVWDLFYLNYFGSKQKFRPNNYLLCDECNQEIRDKKHKTADGITLCDNCFKIRATEQARKRVEKYRNRKS